MTDTTMQRPTRAEAFNYPAGEYHPPFATVKIEDQNGSRFTLYVETREQADAIAGAINAAVRKPEEVA